MGTRSHVQDRVLGPFGEDRVNSASRELHDLLDSKRLCSAATFFAKPVYGTWRHPRSKNRFQLDHVLIQQDIFSPVRDAGIYNQGTVESDHAPLQIKLRIARNLSKQSGSNGTFTNRELLINPAIARKFRQVVLAHLGIQSPPSPSPSPSQAIFQEIEKTEACRADLQMYLLLRALQLERVSQRAPGAAAATVACDSFALRKHLEGKSYSDLDEVVANASGKVLTTSERKRPGWFNENQLALMTAINTCNIAQRNYDRLCKPCESKPQLEHELLKQSRKMLTKTILDSKTHGCRTRLS